MKIIDTKTVLNFVTVNRFVALDCTVFEDVLETFSRHNDALLKVNDDLICDYLKTKACFAFDISVAEFDSNMKYGKIGLARHTVCYVLNLLGYRNKDIAEMLSFSRPRVTAAIDTIEKLCVKHPKIKDVVIQLHALTLKWMYES